MVDEEAEVDTDEIMTIDEEEEEIHGMVVEEAVEVVEEVEVEEATSGMIVIETGRDRLLRQERSRSQRGRNISQSGT